MKMRRSLMRASDRDKAAILSALRGPDFEDARSELKTKYTTPIRCWIYECYPEGLDRLGMAHGDCAPTTTEKWRELRDEVASKYMSSSYGDRDVHYLNHIYSALKAIARINVRSEAARGASPRASVGRRR